MKCWRQAGYSMWRNSPTGTDAPVWRFLDARNMGSLSINRGYRVNALQSRRRSNSDLRRKALDAPAPRVQTRKARRGSTQASTSTPRLTAASIARLQWPSLRPSFGSYHLKSINPESWPGLADVFFPCIAARLRPLHSCSNTHLDTPIPAKPWFPLGDNGACGYAPSELFLIAWARYLADPRWARLQGWLKVG